MSRNEGRTEIKWDGTSTWPPEHLKKAMLKEQEEQLGYEVPVESLEEQDGD